MAAAFLTPPPDWPLARFWEICILIRHTPHGLWELTGGLPLFGPAASSRLTQKRPTTGTAP